MPSTIDQLPPSTGLASGDLLPVRDISISSDNAAATKKVTPVELTSTFNVKWYGAVADGTTEAATGINAAITAAAVSGGTVVVPAGTYRVSGIVGQRILPRSNVVLWFEPGVTITTGVPASTSYVVNIDTASFSNISNVRIYGNGLIVQGDTSSSAICYGIQVNVQADNHVCEHVYIDGVTLKNFKTDGLTIGSNSATYMPEHIYVTNVFGTSNYRHGASVIGGRKIFFDGCQFKSNSGDTLACGLDIEPDTGLVAQDINITDCRFDSNSSGGLYVQNGAGTTSRVRVVNCSAENNTGFGFDYAGASSVLATNCYARGNGSFGYFSLACSPISLSNCIAESNTTNGFWIVAGTSTGLSNCRSISNTQSGYLLARDSTTQTGQIVLSNCDADSNANRGMYLSYVSDVTIVGGSVTRSGNDGIDIANSCNCTITGVEITGNGTSSDLNGDNVLLEGASHYNNISVNTVRQSRRFFHGTATAGASTTVTLPATCLAEDDVYIGYTIRILSGTGSGQSKTITDFVGSTRVVTVNSAWSVDPDATSVVEIADATRPRYGVRVNSGCTGNKITDNDLYYAGATGAYSDAGSGTVTSSANRTT